MMNFFRSKQDARLDEAISELRAEQPDAKTLSASAERVWQKVQTGMGEEAAASALQPIRGCADIRALLPAFHQQELPAARALIVEDHLRECVSCRSYAHGRAVDGKSSSNWRMEPASRGFQWSFGAMSLAAAGLALLVAAVWMGRSWYNDGPPGSRGRVDSVAGQAYLIGASGEHALKSGDEIAQGEFIRTAANSRAIVRLFDGSKVEMNQRAALAVSADRRNATIHLDQGSIIVHAAKRRTGHLYVSAPDCTVAVTGTVFSVNSGTKGSRVSVIEGEVHVKHSGMESILHSGDQVATTQSVGVVPVSQEIAWSSDRDQELALLAEFGKLRTQLETIPMPSPRYESKVLPLLPADTVLYIGIPNLGDALKQANQIFQQQLSQSTVLQDWWNKRGNANQHPTPEELIDQIQAVSSYLGDEVVITVEDFSSTNMHGPILLAEVKQTGLKEYLQSNLAAAISNKQGNSDLQVVDQQSLSSLSANEHGMIMLVRQNMLVVGGDAASVQRMSARLDAGSAQFASTDFGQRILGVYSHGTETVVAANLGEILSSTHTQPSENKFLQSTGFDDIKYLIATRGETSNQGDNRMTLEFSGPRRGIASWLAAPAPVGSLDYVSANAGAVFSFVGKQPALLFDDISNTFGTDPNFAKGLAEANAELGFDIRNDLETALGGELTIALDGPVLPTPSWKAIIEVNQSGAVQLAIEKMVQVANRQAQKSNQPVNITLNQTQVGGRTFYTIQTQGAAITTEYDYTFADGYLIIAPSRALLLAAIETHANGTSLARSESFRALLPSDNQANFSAMIYQNLGPILKPLASQLNSKELVLLQQLAVDSKPSVMCAYGESDRIEVASSGKLLDLNPTFPALLHLLGMSEHEHGTSR
jgi:ferric-dicitrate binding protein FerR (iron transport regulator)